MVSGATDREFPSLAPLLAALPVSATLYDLPSDLCGLVLGHLEDLKDRAHFTAVCRKFRSTQHLQAIYVGKESELVSRIFSFAIRHKKPVYKSQLDSFNRKVTVLNLRGAMLTPEQLESLVTLYPNLTIVKLSGCGLTDEHIELLASLSQLTELDISKNPKVTGAAFHMLPASVIELNCSDCTITDNGVQSLSHLTKLECLEIRQNILITGVTFDHLPGSLKTLLVNLCSLNDAAVPKLKHLLNLEYLTMIGHPEIVGATIGELPVTIKHLDLSQCDLTNAAVVALGQKLTQLETLKVSGNDLITCNVSEHVPSTCRL